MTDIPTDIPTSPPPAEPLVAVPDQIPDQPEGNYLGSIDTGAASGTVWFMLDDQRLDAVPALPADEFGEFTKITTRLTNISGKLKGETDPDKVAQTLDEFIREALNGLGMILIEASLAIVTDRIRNRRKPLDVPNLVKVFMMLVGHYNKGQSSDDQADAPGDAGAPFDGASGSSPGSGTATTGDAPEATSSAEASTSPAGLPTT